MDLVDVDGVRPEPPQAALASRDQVLAGRAHVVQPRARALAALGRRDHLISQIATSNARPGRGGRRKLPYAFTEYGALMAASVLSSTKAVAMSILVVRAFVRFRRLLATHSELAAKIVKPHVADDPRVRRSE
jgi:hypothetical protein